MELLLQSENTAELVTALTKASGIIKPARKDSENPFFHSKYADLSAITEASRDALVSNNLVVTQSTTIQEGQCVLVTTLHHVSGQWVRGYYPVTAIKADPQSMGSAITYARRYALSAILGIVSEDDDGEGAMGRKDNGSSYQTSPQGRAFTEHRIESNLPMSNQPIPADPLDWKSAIIHFGKSKGKPLGSLTSNQIRWWIKEWMPQPFKGKINTIDTALREALDKASIELGMEENKSTEELA